MRELIGDKSSFNTIRNVKTFQDPIKGTQDLKNHRADLVITDIKMPKMDGIKILEEVKKIDEDIPVILMTGFGTFESAVTAISQGAYDYLIKPVEFSHLKLAVKRALEKRKWIDCLSIVRSTNGFNLGELWRKFL